MKRFRSRLNKFGLVVTGRRKPDFLVRRDSPNDPAPPDSEVGNRLVRAKLLIAENRRDEARAILDSITRPHGIRLTRRRELAKLLQKSGDPSASLAEWRNILARTPRNASAAKKVAALEPRVALMLSASATTAQDLEAAVAALLPLVEKRPNHPRALQPLIELLVASGRTAEARKLVGRAREKNPSNRKPLMFLAGAFGKAADVSQVYPSWSEAVECGNINFLAIIARAGRTKGKSQPGNAAPAESGGETRTTMEMADDFYRNADEAGLFRFLSSQSGNCPIGCWSDLRKYYEAKWLAVHNGLAGAFQLATELLEKPDLFRDPSPDGVDRRLELEVILLRCLTQFGRYDEAMERLKTITGVDPAGLAEIELDLCWRRDPSRALELVCEMWSHPAPSTKTSVLFCMLPLALGDVQKAAKHLNMDVIRRDHDVRMVPGDLLLAAAAIQQAIGNNPLRQKIVERYFWRFALESPVAEAGEDCCYDLLAAQVHWRSSAGPLVSVIMTSYNAEKTIRQALDSVRNQTHANTEIIIIDDASTDGTYAALTDMASSDPRIRLFRNTHNSGTYVSKNFAMEMARGTYFMFFDADDWAHPRRIERHLARMAKDPDLVATTSDWIRMEEAGSPVLRPWIAGFAHLNPGSMFCHTVVRDEIGFFDNVRIDADLDYLLRARAHFGPKRVIKIATPLTIGRFHSGSLTRSGLGAQNDEGFSKIRSDYRTESFHWRIQRILAGQSLRLEASGTLRDLPCAREIKVSHHPEPLAHA